MSTYDPKCRICRRVDIMGICSVEAVMGGVVGVWASSIPKMAIVVILLQPAVYVARLVVNRTQPMTHHYFTKEVEK